MRELCPWNGPPPLCTPQYMRAASSSLTLSFMCYRKLILKSFALQLTSHINILSMVGLVTYGVLCQQTQMVCPFHLFISFFTLSFLGHILPLAIGHHSGNESKSTWSWFLQKMKEKFPSMAKCVVLLDRDKGGRDAVRCLFFLVSFIFLSFFKKNYSSIMEDEKIGGCSFHISKNIASQFGEEASVSFLRTSQKKTTDDFYQHLANFAEQFVFFLPYYSNILIVFFDRHSSAFQYLSSISPAMYATAFIQGTGGRTSSQLIESLWAVLLPSRSEPLLTFYLSALKIFVKWHHKYRYDYSCNFFILFTNPLQGNVQAANPKRVAFWQENHAKVGVTATRCSKALYSAAG